MKKILVIDENEKFREYLVKKLKSQMFDAIDGSNGLDGSLKLRRMIPDLIIMDHVLTRKSCVEVLQEKEENPNVKNTPVILFSTKVDKGLVAGFARYGVKKIFSKPVKIDSLLKGISEILGTPFQIDDTPCVLEANFNDEIIFIEVARGLNIEKIEILKFKLDDLVQNYNIAAPKILLMLSGIDLLEEKDIIKIQALLDIVLSTVQQNFENIVVLTSSRNIKDFIKSHIEYKTVPIRSSLGDALDELVGKKSNSLSQDKIVE